METIRTGYWKISSRAATNGYHCRRFHRVTPTATVSTNTNRRSLNGCDYCLTVHSFSAEHMAKLPADEIILARKGHASDPKRDAAVQFARKVIETRGHVSDADLKAVRDAGYTDANVMEIVALVAMYSLTNFFNNVFDPEKDFPAVTPAGSI